MTFSVTFLADHCLQVLLPAINEFNEKSVNQDEIDYIQANILYHSKLYLVNKGITFFIMH